MKRIIFIIVIGSALLMVNITLAFAYENSVYIWQRNWDRFVDEAINDISPSVNSFIVLAGDYRYENGESNINTVGIDWEYFTKGTRVILAFRINTQTKHLFDSNGTDKVADSIGAVLNKAINTAQNRGVQVKGIQLDYDCPTARLNDYVVFLDAMRKCLPDQDISITALPTWLDSIHFKNLISKTVYYVLQLHSFEVPKTIDDAKQIFLKDKALFYVSKASELKHPYYISLPTYGYEVAFDENGRFVGLRAEVDPSTMKENFEYQTVISKPEEILNFLHRLNNVKGLLGVCWFRMPIKTDEFNWHAQTFKMVLKDLIPESDFKIHVNNPQKGLYEVYLVNSGDQNVLGPVTFYISWDKDIMPFYDVVGQYRADKKANGTGIQISGIPPKVGNKVLVAWFRFGDIDRNPLYLSEVIFDGSTL